VNGVWSVCRVEGGFKESLMWSRREGVRIKEEAGY
jgi:hypothetical protein